MSVKHLIGAILLAANVNTAMADSQPKEIRSQGKNGIAFPAGFLAAVKRDYPGLHIPRQEDWHTWAELGDLPHPYVGWGDFNGDGRTDIAIVLVSNTHHAVAIYEQEPGESYKCVSRETPIDNKERRAEDEYIRVYRKGQPYIYEVAGGEDGYDIKKRDEYRFHNDAVELGLFGQSSTIIYWNGISYKSIDYGTL